MAIKPEDIYYPYTGSNSLLDFVNQARVADSSNSSIVDPTTGINLADYLLLQREAGATPSFTNNPQQGNIDNFVVPNTTKAMVNDTQRSVVQLFPDEYNPETVNDATDAENMIVNLRTKRDEALRNLENEKAQELGLYDLRDQILAIKSQPYYSQSEYAQQQVRNLATQYEAKRGLVEAYLNDPNIAKQFSDVDNAISRWTIRANDLRKDEDQRRVIDQRIGKLPGETDEEAVARKANIKNKEITAVNRINAQHTFSSEQEEKLTMKYAGLEDKNQLYDGVAAKDPKILSARWLAKKEEIAGRDLSVSDIFGYAPPEIENYAVNQILDKKVQDGVITSEDARNWQTKVIPLANELAIQNIEQETIAYQRKQIEAELAKINRGREKDKQIKFDDFINSNPGKLLTDITKISDARKAEIEGHAKVKGYKKALELYKNSLISDSFGEATDLANVPDIPLTIKQKNAQMRAKYPEAFVFPTNPDNNEQVNRFANIWRDIIANESSDTADVMQATFDHAIHAINQENDRKLVDGTATILPSNKVFSVLSAYMMLGKLQLAKRQAGILGLLISDQIAGRSAGMTPEEIAMAEAVKNGGQQ